jgi:hypothetical protein
MHAATVSALFEYKNVLQREEGDFIFDNLAVGHEDATETLPPRNELGFKVSQSTTIKGTVPPVK